MLFMIDYTTRSAPQIKVCKFVNHASDSIEAIKRFMNWFFRNHPDDAVKLQEVTEIEFIGDLANIDIIDDIIEGKI
jgi:hypothetical protein